MKQKPSQIPRSPPRIYGKSREQKQQNESLKLTVALAVRTDHVLRAFDQISKSACMSVSGCLVLSRHGRWR